MLQKRLLPVRIQGTSWWFYVLCNRAWILEDIGAIHLLLLLLLRLLLLLLLQLLQQLLYYSCCSCYCCCCCFCCWTRQESCNAVCHAGIVKCIWHDWTWTFDNTVVRETALSWFRTYLEDRTQCVQIDAKTSATIPLQSGVPHGPVLGPVRFNLYTTPMQRILKKYHKYADDIQL